MSVNIYDNDGKFIKSFNPSNKPIKMFRDEYIFKNILENKYNDLIIVDIDKENIKIMNEKQLKEHCKILKRKYKHNKKNEEIKKITKDNEIIIDNDPTNINIIDYNGNILKIITQQFKKSKFLLYKPFIKKEYPNMYDIDIDDNTIKIMNEEQYTNYKKELQSEYKKKYMENNKEKIKEVRKEYYNKNKDIIREKNRKYRENNKDFL
jgi:hypothetical protein